MVGLVVDGRLDSQGAVVLDDVAILDHHAVVKDGIIRLRVSSAVDVDTTGNTHVKYWAGGRRVVGWPRSGSIVACNDRAGCPQGGVEFC